MIKFCFCSVYLFKHFFCNGFIGNIEINIGVAKTCSLLSHLCIVNMLFWTC